MTRDVLIRVLIGTLTVVGCFALTASADPPSDSDHGVNETTFDLLWSGDVDSDKSSLEAQNTTELEELAETTDIPFDAPPEAVEQWNRGDHDEFPHTSHETSIYPPNASLTDGVFVKDAYVEIFAIQPSTRARLAPEEMPLYVAPSGAVLATTDYRIETPAVVLTNETRISWSIDRHEIVETRLLIDDTLETKVAGTHTPTLSYDSIDELDGQNHTLTVETDIEVALWRVTEACAEGSNASFCELEEVGAEYMAERRTVQTERDISVQSLPVTGIQGYFPNGDQGLSVYSSEPWRGFSVGNTSVTGVWQFYSARDPAWDTLITSTESGQSSRHSPVHPLQVTAFPSSLGPSVTPLMTGRLVEAYGPERASPTLPPDVLLDAATEPYTASHGLVAQVNTEDQDAETVTSYGLVRGVQVTHPTDSFRDVVVNESVLSLAIEDQTDQRVTVTVSLQDAETGAPIDTSTRPGAVVINGERVNTDATGSASISVPRLAGAVTARYEPAPWWEASLGYLQDTDTVYIKGTPIGFLDTLYRMAIPIGGLLFGVYLIERITGWRVLRSWRH